jgi:hypothetical protein
MIYAYEKLLRLYPAPFRNVFGREMAAVFAQATNEVRARGLLRYLAFLCAEFAGLFTGAFAMWTGESMSRAQRRFNAPFVISLVGGIALTAFTQSCFYGGIGGSMARNQALRADAAMLATPGVHVPVDVALVIVLTGGALIFIGVMSFAFVWNMRSLATRAGRLKPIWMPGGDNARAARCDKTLYRHSGCERRELHRRGGRGDRLSRAQRVGQIYHLEDDHGADRTQ